MLFCSLLTFAQFSGSGSGTEDDPYLILNPIQLNQLRNFLNQSGVYFKMMADVDLTEFLEEENPEQGWQPVGNSSSAAFKGILDGNGKTIKGLWIKRTFTDNVGFFGYTAGATIKDVTIESATIEGKESVGGVSGHSHSSTISGCSFMGSVKGGSMIGGFVGGAGDYLTLTDNTAKVNVTGTGNSVGGFIGRNEAEYNLTISGCTLNDGVIRGIDNVGGCCGENISYHWRSNSISNTYIHANIFGANYVGGICGISSNAECTVNLNNCGFIGEIVGSSFIGGLVGKLVTDNYSKRNTIQNSFSLGAIVATGDYVGGIVGTDTGYSGDGYSNSTDLTNNYHSGSVTGVNYVGGLVGQRGRQGVTSNCYAIGSVAGARYVGGLIGYNSANLKKSMAINTRVTATTGDVNRLVGYNAGTISTMGSTDENKSYNRTIVIDQGVAQEITDDQMNGTGVSATTLKLKATYVAMGWDFTDTWEIQETECYPYMKTQTAPPIITSNVVSGATAISGKCVSGATIILEIDGVKQEMVSPTSTFIFTVDPLQAGHEVRLCAKAEGKEQSYFTTEVVSYLGKGTEDDPYQISTAADLSYAYRKGYYKLMNNIDLTDYINHYSPTEGWESIGREGSETIYLDGDGHKVTGLWCNSTRDNTGLFSCFANGYLKNLTVETASGKQVKGGSNTGILIGKMINGTIENCRVSGNLTDGTPVGGIVGLLDGGKILKSQASVIINTSGDNTYVGGLVGDITSGEIDQCVTLGTITATGKNSQAGGLVGKNAATVTNCYSNATVTSAYCAAGLISYNFGLVEKCYATGNLSSQNYGAGVIGYNEGENAIIRNCAAMNQKIDVTYESQSAQSGGYGQRILGGYKNGAPDPEMNNYALKSMQLSVNEVPQKVYNDIMNGTAKKGSELMTASTYQSLGWDFTDMWNITAGESYPFLRNNVAEVKKYVKVAPAVIAPTALPNLIYNGEAQSLVTAGVTTSGYIYYSLDGTNYSRTIPTGINANSYVVYYKVIDDEDSSESNQGSTSVTISAKLLDNPTVTLSETSYIYDGTAKKPTVTVEDGETTVPTTDYTLSYSNNTKVGTATVTILSKDGKNYKFPSSGLTTEFQIFREITNLFGESDFWSGYVAQEDLALPSGLTAYVITTLGSTSATATSVNYIPEGVPVLLKRNSSTENTFKASAGTGTAPTANLLKAYTTSKEVSDQEGYILYKDKFVLVKEGTLPAGKVFLPANGSGSSSARSIIIDGEDTTGIDNCLNVLNESNDQWYDIQGRRLAQKPTKKGVFILNGRKVVVK